MKQFLWNHPCFVLLFKDLNKLTLESGNKNRRVAETLSTAASWKLKLFHECVSRMNQDMLISFLNLLLH